MNKNKIVSWAFCLSSLLTSLLSFNAQGVDMEFKGELVDTACKVTSESLNQKITIYNVRLKSINEGKPSAITPFSITIDKCSETDLKKVIKLTWSSNQLLNIGNDTFLNTQGDSGVLLGVTDKDDKLIVWNRPITLGSVPEVGKTRELNFGVFARKPATKEAKAGKFSASITFTVEYE
ncbi:fimbrial protein [Providencia sp. Me31A]|uniref:fimbrial protein n=1 Tax=Providencia sp. Me31A TaxID=3392637 RepID=UPI003D2C762F